MFRRRTVLASGLEHAIGDARRPPRRPALTAAVPVAREEVLLAEPALRELADRLRAPGTAPKEPVDRVRAVLTDGESPLYLPIHPGALRDWALDVLAAWPPTRR